MMQFKQYDVVKIIEINKKFDEDDLKYNIRLPKVGDIAYIIEIYTHPHLGYDLECSDKDGITQWLMAFSPKEIKLELITE